MFGSINNVSIYSPKQDNSEEENSKEEDVYYVNDQVIGKIDYTKKHS